ncbi:acyl-CoA dehydrogenase family protein [Polaromonas sp.]|uniref:acyl-CoA dehydrogenase family protein n=1 Tax=Polaromonas sp. TaxID=1869339 RepID=UPI0035699AB0
MAEGLADADLASAEAALLKRARTFVDEHVEPKASERSRQGASSQALMREAGRLGLIGVQIPRSLGGLGLPFSSKVKLTRLLAAADFGVAMAVVNSHNVVEHLARMGCSDHISRWVPRLLTGEMTGCTALTEPQAGSDAAAMLTQAQAVDGGWRLDGAKSWITNAVHADVLIVYAQTQPGGGAAGIAAFVVDAQATGFERAAQPPQGPVSSIGSGSFKLAQYQCDGQDMLAAPGVAFKDILNSINGARVYVAAMCCGMVDRALALASEYGVFRQTFGASLHAHQGWRWRLADAAIDLEAANLLVDHASVLVDDGDHLRAQVAAAKAKVFATRMAQRHLAELLHAMGAQGLSEQHPLTRHLAAAQVATLVDGSTEMLLERIARDVQGQADTAVGLTIHSTQQTKDQ